MRIGIDLGGTKTEIICLNDKNGKEIYRQRVPSPKNDYKATLKNIGELVARAEETLGIKGTVGVGIPGTVSKVTGLVKNANSVWLNGHPLDKDLEKILERPVRVQNDANCLAVSEASDGAGAGKDVVFAVIIGTGCGAGITIHGKPISGLNGIGGEWGHNPLPHPKLFTDNKTKICDVWDVHIDPETTVNPTYALKERPDYFVDDLAVNEFPGPQCYCGKRGCLETWISGTGLKNDYARVTGESLSTHDIVANAKQGEAKALDALNRYTDRLARGLAGVIDILDPDVVVLGGGMSNVTSLYTDVPKIWDQYIFSDTVETPIVKSAHGDSSGVRGAAWLWND